MELETLKYSKEHQWIRLDGDNAIIGITDFAQKQLTDIVFIELPEKGKSITKSKAIASVESVKSVSNIISPLSGVVIDVNTKLKDAPEMLNKDPYGEGWIIKIKIENKDELKDLISYGEYKKLVGNK